MVNFVKPRQMIVGLLLAIGVTIGLFGLGGVMGLLQFELTEGNRLDTKVCNWLVRAGQEKEGLCILLLIFCLYLLTTALSTTLRSFFVTGCLMEVLIFAMTFTNENVNIGIGNGIFIMIVLGAILWYFKVKLNRIDVYNGNKVIINGKARRRK